MPAIEKKVLIPLIDAERMDWSAAMERLGIRRRTLTALNGKHPLSRWIAGRRVFSAVAVEMLRDADHEALNLYGEGERVDPKVRRYYDRLGIALPAFVFVEA